MNTPKQKAKELIEKFLGLQEKINWGNINQKKEAGLIYKKNHIEYNKYYDELAKQSSLIAVEQMQLIMDSLWKIQGTNEGEKSTYLLEVIKEIENYERAS